MFYISKKKKKKLVIECDLTSPPKFLTVGR